jgi:hypothetical protein
LEAGFDGLENRTGGRGGGGRGGEGVGWGWFIFFIISEEGFFSMVTHILVLTTLDTYLSKSFLRLGIYYKYPNRDLISLSPFQM